MLDAVVGESEELEESLVNVVGALHKEPQTVTPSVGLAMAIMPLGSM